MSQFRETLKIKTFTIQNVLQCMKNVRDNYLN